MGKGSEMDKRGRKWGKGQKNFKVNQCILETERNGREYRLQNYQKFLVVRDPFKRVRIFKILFYYKKYYRVNRRL